MTIRSSINVRSMNDSLRNIQACAEDAPEGTYDFAKEFVKQFQEAIGDFHKDLHERMGKLGLKVSNTDTFCEIEALTYGMIVAENYDNAGIITSQSFGEAMRDHYSKGHSGNTVRENVLAGAIRDRDALRSMNAASIAINAASNLFTGAASPKSEEA